MSSWYLQDTQHSPWVSLCGHGITFGPVLRGELGGIQAGLKPEAE